MAERFYHSKEEVLSRGRQVIGIPFKGLDETGRLATGKGAIGNVIEESWFGLKVNNESRPDFEEAGVELKVTPYVRNRKGIVAKERLVCNIIDYMKEYDKNFKTSSFWIKCNTMLLMSYEHIEDSPKGEYKIDEVILFSFPEEDLAIIEQDWEKIIGKVRAGKAHEITEGDTMYLAACTKGTSAESVREQPFSAIPAKQRAYSLKQAYMTVLLNKYIFGEEQNERIIKDPEKLREQGFEEYLISKIRPFLGKSQSELVRMFSLKSKAKNLNELILAKILGVKGRISETDEFRKANIVPKTIRIERDGRIKESMSFPMFDFISLTREDWETSILKDYLESTKFLFTIFRNDRCGKLIFDNILFWNMPEKDLDQVKAVWQRTKDIVIKGVTLKQKNGRMSNDLPKKSENSVAHVRPHARNASDKIFLPNGEEMTKQCFWLNNTYIRSQIEASTTKK